MHTGPKPETIIIHKRVKKALRKTPAAAADIATTIEGVSVALVRRALRSLRESGVAEMIGIKRAAKYALA